MPSAIRIALAFALATLVLVLALAKWVGPLGWMDEPSGRKQHDRAIPLIGGLVLLIVIVGAKLMGWLSLGMTSLEWGTVVAMGALGILDDRYDLRARWKALVGLLLALPLAAVHTWEMLHLSQNVTLFGFNIPNHAQVYFPLLTMWYWAIPHAFNLIDGLNGLSLGFSLLLLAALSVGPGSLLGAGAAPLWGVLVVLLLLNYPKARHFMGDAGALALGTLFAILVLNRSLPWHRGLAFFLMAYPILDVTTVVAIRWTTGQPLGHADRSHLHHWLMDHLGGRAWVVSPLLLSLAALPMARDLPRAWAQPVSYLGLGALVLLAAVVFVDRALLHPRRHVNSVESLASPSHSEQPPGPDQWA